MLSTKDIEQVKTHGLTVQQIEEQVERFRKGFPKPRIHAPATPGKGILQLSPKEQQHYIQRFEKKSGSYQRVRFIPASGAATRMFKTLFEYLESPGKNKEKVEGFIHDLPKYPFYNDLAKGFENRHQESIQSLVKSGNYNDIISFLLYQEGMNFSAKPKGLLPFHAYTGETRTPLQEHMAEATKEGALKNGKVQLHLTVLPEHQDAFKKAFLEAKEVFEARKPVQFSASFSIQKPATDTIAVDMDNQPFRLSDGSLLFRPGGHGALLENLNELETDHIFIKNIDNVAREEVQAKIAPYNKLLAGVLVEYQQKIFSFLEQMDSKVDEEFIAKVMDFLSQELFLGIPEIVKQAPLEEKAVFCRAKLDRPTRVCAMVKNEGQAGGGPFMLEEKNGARSLQIVEKAQANLDDPEQKELFYAATHFNPTHMICGVRNYKGQAFDLLKYRDEEAGFISQKTLQGKPLKALELPGLWNGSMADWNSVFVEVPIDTFHPVKTIFDLLNPGHFPGEG
jgi:hypothetical protein